MSSVYTDIFERMLLGETLVLADVAACTVRRALQTEQAKLQTHAKELGIEIERKSISIEVQDDGSLRCSLVPPRQKGFARKVRIL